MSTQELTLPPCPECSSEYTYESGALLTCPMCAHEWAPAEAAPAVDSRDQDEAIRDAVGNPLTDGDTVTLAKSVKITGGGGGTLKAGTKVRNIRDRKSTRLNSSHVSISYAVFCLKKKNRATS